MENMNEDGKGRMTIIEKVMEDNEDCNIFYVMKDECPSKYGFSDICCLRMGHKERMKACLMCWTREID